jgi:hypothetical protein
MHPTAQYSYQSTRSSRCAVYAAANLFELYGHRLERATLLKAFGWTASTTRPVTHRILLNAVSHLLEHVGRDGSALSWSPLPGFNPGAMRRLWCISNPSDTPTLATFRIRHRRRDWGGRHCAVVLGCSSVQIQLLDALGRRDGSSPNAQISHLKSGGQLLTTGLPYLAIARDARLLTGLPHSTRSSE